MSALAVYAHGLSGNVKKPKKLKPKKSAKVKVKAKPAPRPPVQVKAPRPPVAAPVRGRFDNWLKFYDRQTPKAGQPAKPAKPPKTKTNLTDIINRGTGIVTRVVDDLRDKGILPAPTTPTPDPLPAPIPPSVPTTPAPSGGGMFGNIPPVVLFGGLGLLAVVMLSRGGSGNSPQPVYVGR